MVEPSICDWILMFLILFKIFIDFLCDLDNKKKD